MSMPHSSNPTLGCLAGCTFVVAPYQRGYKWTPTEVTTLLDDIYSFEPSDGQPLYSLQPLVVRSHRDPSDDPSDNQFELIDGQQRVTTLYLILSALGGSPFQIRYATREGSETYLALEGAKETPSASDWRTFAISHPEYDNVDVYHFFHAQTAICGWLEHTLPAHTDHKDFREKILSSVSVIWYQPTGVIDAHRLFRDLNVGKIPLTDAELIKAELLRTVGGDKPLGLAHDWDDMERHLHDPQLWAFLSPLSHGTDYVNRMELPLRLATDMHISMDTPGQLPLYHKAMMLANRLPGHGNGLLLFWQDVRWVFRTFQDWYADDEAFHWVGFLRRSRSTDATLPSLTALWKQQRTKSDFLRHLRSRVARALPSAGDLKTLQYQHSEADGRTQGNNALIHNVLLFFNIHTLRSGLGTHVHWRSRFRFDLHDAQTWSLEHIHAQNELPPRSDFKRLAGWLRAEARNPDPDPSASKYKDIDPNGTIAAWKATEEGTHETIDTLFTTAESLKQKVKERSDSHVLHGLQNLALLDRDMNASLNNGYFDEKRGRLVALDRSGAYIPPATRHAFLKYYTSTPESVNNWDECDATAYLKAIQDTVESFGLEVQPCSI